MTEKLSHLTKEEVEQLIAEYYAGVKVNALINKYAINVLPGQLVKTFPPKKLDRNCTYCGDILVEEYLSKTSYYNTSAATCLKCGHNESGRCNCGSCKDAAKLALAAEKERQEILRQQMRAQLQDALKANTSQPVDYNELSFEQKVYLGAVLRGGIDENYNYVRPIEELNYPLSPIKKFDDEIIDSLIKVQHCLAISPNSNLSAFSRNENGIFRYSPSSVSWTLNTYIDGLEKVYLNRLYYES